ncbi:hypothetical protein [Jeongeupia naejangsanensis]|uniref:Uncharacterized protein n=1 Tax=Jeongeupia naejangsanensis TaxID=613195 RepID=A0ABS2BNQ1_9NEIS|nr:hypothetical protein [Jeongeupia naejangsanensis]MBM3117256.1 hypothetical protein [Jeongeupia naejangsanensis]
MNFKLPDGIKDGDHPSLLFATSPATVSPEDRAEQAAKARRMALVKLKSAVMSRIVAKARELGDTPEHLLSELAQIYRQQSGHI